VRAFGEGRAPVNPPPPSIISHLGQALVHLAQGPVLGGHAFSRHLQALDVGLALVGVGPCDSAVRTGANLEGAIAASMTAG
jgi:hypothetical protein